MAPEQALGFLDALVSTMTMNRQDHIRAIEAVRTLSAVLHPTPTPPPDGTGETQKPQLVK